MNYWITTHWPPRQGEPDEVSPGISLPEGRHTAGNDIAPGDLVLIYQSKTGRVLLRKRPDGMVSRVASRLGRGGLVCVARVTGALSIVSDSSPEHYGDGTSLWWRYYAPAEALSRSGFVPRSELAVLLGYKSGNTFHGFGDQHSGLKRISEDQYTNIVERFHYSRPITLPEGSAPGGGGYGGGGESEIHLNLKRFVAAIPSIALSEAGLQTLKMEYEFSTGDKADIALVDEFNRIIGVEIEPEVRYLNHPGPLQAIKYRRMLEMATDRAPGDSRSILVAHEISGEVRTKSEEYEIECHEIPRQRVLDWLREFSDNSDVN